MLKIYFSKCDIFARLNQFIMQFICCNIQKRIKYCNIQVMNKYKNIRRECNKKVNY